ncbi:hypothetical protein D9611_007297 [Ephemerocybe angulata]|uniref:F-box domain-containing protein n=1 Tax=Ephemerocybe angulata TaxID=980116 RepID=A0A8H5CG01_9AGAR|nr:hypothetical protein D9611_007297 [Tulosesus angulatus]
MELTLEAITIIVNNTGSRSDIAVLCRVSKTFRRVAERALYNTIYLRTPGESQAVSNTLATCARIASLVASLTISIVEEDETEDESDESYEDDYRDVLPEGFWEGMAVALQKATNLRSLTIHSQGTSIPASAEILRSTTFSLRKFHCDFDWDNDLVQFLNAQTELQDLYILDFKQTLTTNPTIQTTTTISTPPPPTSSMTLNASAMPNLMTLECTFSEAADHIVPHRPITHLKTCFSRTEMSEKRVEMDRLFTNISLSSKALRSLDIADSSYSESFAMEILRKVVSTEVTRKDLRYLGTLVLPVEGQERLQFYGLLMKLPALKCLEVEVSAWVPPPTSTAAFRALASELRLYCLTVTSVVFVLDFERTLVTIRNGVCAVNADAGTDLLWREM